MSKTTIHQKLAVLKPWLEDLKKNSKKKPNRKVYVIEEEE